MSSSGSAVSEPPVEPRRRASRWPLFWVAVASFAPLALAYLTFYFWAPEGRMNYGELIEPPRALPDIELRLVDGRPFRLGDLRGKWILMQVGPGACDEDCQRRLYHMRQVRRAQGKNMDRIERVWLIGDDTPLDPAVVGAFDGTYFVRAAGSGILRERALATGHIYLIDPLGNLIMMFPRDADPNRLLRDMTRLLKASQVG
jgi:cytochrome oxidase Cu insertion factor (SCO1/SenC/PrrC family)